MNKIKYLILFLCLFITNDFVSAESGIPDDSTTPMVVATEPTTRSSATTTSKTTTSSRVRTTTSYDPYDYYNSSSSYDLYQTTSLKTRNVEGTSYKTFIDDSASLLSDSEEEALFKDMEKLAPYGNIGFLSISKSTSSETSLAESYYVSNFGQTNGVLFMINMGTRQITLRAFSTVSGVDLIDSNRVDSILANVYRFAHNGDYYRCAKTAFDQSYTVISGKTIFEPMKIASNAILAFATSSFILYIYVLSVSSIKKASNKELMAGIKKNVKISNIRIIPNGTRSVYSPQSSSSGGSSGGGGGGGGGGFHSSGGSHGF